MILAQFLAEVVFKPGEVKPWAPPQRVENPDACWVVRNPDTNEILWLPPSAVKEALHRVVWASFEIGWSITTPVGTYIHKFTGNYIKLDPKKHVSTVEEF